jgi:hypothetical protein
VVVRNAGQAQRSTINRGGAYCEALAPKRSPASKKGSLAGGRFELLPILTDLLLHPVSLAANLIVAVHSRVARHHLSSNLYMPTIVIVIL